jgi:hypothetical protein
MNLVLQIFLFLTYYPSFTLIGLGAYKFISIQRNVDYTGKYTKLGCVILILAGLSFYLTGNGVISLINQPNQ